MIARPALARETEAALPGYEFWPTLGLVDQTGTHFQIGQLETPLVFVNVWAHWCAACWFEMNALHAMQDKVLPRRMTVLLLSHPTNWSADQQSAARKQLPFRLATLAPGPASIRSAAFEERSSTYNVPRSLLYHHASNGVVMSHDGLAAWDGAQNIGRLLRLLG